MRKRLKEIKGSLTTGSGLVVLFVNTATFMSEKDKKKWLQEFRKLIAESWSRLSGRLSNLVLDQTVRPVSVAQSVSAFGC